MNLYERYHSPARLQKRIIDERNFTYRHLIRILRPFLSSCKTILDTGCGVGTIDFYLASQEKEVVGIEVSKKALETARTNAQLFGLEKKIKFRQMNFPKEAPSEKFDLIICSEVLEHLEDDRSAASSMYNLLKKGGVAVISVPSQNAPLYKLGLLKDFDKEVGHLRRYTEQEISTVFRKAGFRIDSIEKTEGILRNFLFTNKTAGKLIKFIRWRISDLVTALDNLTIPIFGESQIFVVAGK